MAAIAGRKVRVKYNSGSGLAVIAGARVDNGTINNEPIDITDKDDAGWRTLLDDVGVKNMDLSIEGVMINDTLMALAHNAASTAALHDFSLDIDGIGEFTGEFFISTFEAAGSEGTDPATFSCSLMSSGEITYTAD